MEKSIEVFRARGINLDNLKFAHQFLCEVLIEDYVYVVPIVVTEKEVFLKTAYPSRKATKKLKKGKTK